jgi:peptide/nickel transport system substrate-binding protein
VSAGQTITFNLDYQAGTSTIQSEMNDLAAQAKKVGINLQLTAHPFDTVISTAVACQPTAPDCGWTAENWGAGWIFAPDFLPTGESLYGPGAVANYARYMEQNVPVVYGPTSIGTYQGDAGTMIDKKLGGYAANAYGYLTPETYYSTK